MDDDWRLQINLEDEGVVGEVSDLLRSAELEHDLSLDLDKRVILSNEGETIYLYAGDRDQLDRARPPIEKFLAEKGWKADLDLRHWHKEAEEWESPDAPEPTTAAETQAEHERLIAAEDKETEERHGRAEFEVSAKFPTNKEAHRFAEKLRAEGFEPVRRWHYLVVGAADEDAAKALAERIREEAPEDAEVKAEYSLNQLWRERPPNPFFWLGGLGGD
ncbi:MAG TPA: hypothetical protein VHA76_08410 [Solirubrobacterales bacterium]|nr:hypothetical protein [Solirubrobacterales bacterium]